MSRLGKGWNTPSAPKSSPHKVGLGSPIHLFGTPIPTSAEVLLPPPVDQGNSSSCTGNSSAVAIAVAMSHAKGLPAGQFVELPSRLFLYFDARASEGNVARDDGAIISNIFDSAKLLGVCPEKDWTFSEDLAKITAQPDWNAYRRAADQKVVDGAWRISSTGAARVDDVKRAIAANCCVVWGTALDLAFENLQPGDIWPGLTGQEVGGHAMVLHKFNNDVFWTRSSWGDWCEGGSAQVLADAVASPNSDDYWIVKTVDSFIE